jgi:transposase
MVEVLDTRVRHRIRGATVIYLPPYPPDLNPIELAWSRPESGLN